MFFIYLLEFLVALDLGFASFFLKLFNFFCCFVLGFRMNIVVQADGWIVEKISLLANPNQVRPKRFWGVYTKLKIFNMTNYKKGIISTLFFFKFRLQS